MPGDTTRYSFPYQSAGDAPNGPTLGQDLAEAIETTVGGIDDRVTGRYAFLQQVRFTASGAFTKATYPTARKVRVRVQAGGGGGGGVPVTAAANVAAGSGGGGGSYAESMLDVSGLAASVTVTVGAGGTAPSGAAGGAGGASSFGALVTSNGGAGGGVGSAGGTPFTTNAAGGGAAGTGDIAIPGGPSGIAARLGSAAGQGMSSGGGDSQLGYGGFAGRNFAGGPGLGFGGGGGGAGNDPSLAARSGGVGAPGIVIVDIYA